MRFIIESRAYSDSEDSDKIVIGYTLKTGELDETINYLGYFDSFEKAQEFARVFKDNYRKVEYEV